MTAIPKRLSDRRRCRQDRKSGSERRVSRAGGRVGRVYTLVDHVLGDKDDQQGDHAVAGELVTMWPRERQLGKDIQWQKQLPHALQAGLNMLPPGRGLVHPDILMAVC